MAALSASRPALVVRHIQRALSVAQQEMPNLEDIFLPLFRCFPEVWPFWPFSLSFFASGAGFSPSWVGASV